MFLKGLTMLGFDNNDSNSTQQSVLTKNLMNLVMIFPQINWVKVMSMWLQKRRLKKVTWLIKKDPPNKLKISIFELTSKVFICFLNLKTLSAVQDKLQPFGFKRSVSCSCLVAASGQKTSTAMARLGRKRLIRSAYFNLLHLMNKTMFRGDYFQ